MKIAPAIHKFDFCTWAFVQLCEVAEVLGLKSSEVLERYGALSKDAPKCGVLSVTFGKKIENARISKTIKAVRHFEDMGMSEAVGAIFVPAGWANFAIKTHSEGYVRVDLKQIYLTDEKNEPNWLTVTHNTGFDNMFIVAVGQKS